MGKEERAPVHCTDPTPISASVNVDPAVFGKVGTEGAGIWSEWCNGRKTGGNPLRGAPAGGTQARRFGVAVGFLYRATSRFPGSPAVYTGPQSGGPEASVCDGLRLGKRLLCGPGTLLAAWYSAG